MPLITEQISNLINGVSQQPPALRLASQSTTQENGLVTIAEGLKKRPPLEYQMPFIDKDIVDVNKGMDIIDESLDKVNCDTKHFNKIYIFKIYI